LSTWIQLVDLLSVKVAGGPHELDVMDWMTRISLEVVGQGGLGYSFETLDDIKVKENQYAIAAKQLV